MDVFASLDPYAGWETYPEGLGFSALEVDARSCNERISDQSDELFVDKSESCFHSLVFEDKQEG